MTFFSGPSDAYARFMGRFSTPLASAFADLGLEGVTPGLPVLDVGAGPGMLTGELVRRRGAGLVSAVEPSEDFARATETAYPGVRVERVFAERLPHPDDTFGAALGQLVVHFMRDPLAGVRQMARVTVPGGRVSVCVWDHAGGRSPLETFWSTARRLDPRAPGQSSMVGATEGELAELLGTAGLVEVDDTLLQVSVTFADFGSWWQPFGFGMGPAGQYVARLDDSARERLRAALREELGEGPFSVTGAAWAATGVVPDTAVD